MALIPTAQTDQPTTPPPLSGRSFVERIREVQARNLADNLKRLENMPMTMMASPPAAFVIPAPGPTFREVAERYIREVVEPYQTPGSLKNKKTMFDVYFNPRFGDMPLQLVKKADIKKLVTEIGTTRRYSRHKVWTGGCTERANTAFAYLRRFFNWCIGDEHDMGVILEGNPCHGMKKPFRPVYRDRFLSDEEIKYFWWASCLEGFPYGTIAQLLLLTGQRRGEIANVLKNQIDRQEAMLTIPATANKSRRTHLVPLSDLALGVLRGVAFAPGRPLLFSRDGVTRLGDINYTHATRRMTRRMVEFKRADIERAGGDPDDAVIERWILHDLRRTAATTMCRLGHLPEVVDRILNHAPGSSGWPYAKNVAHIYIRHDYLAERRVALQAFADHVVKVTGI